MGEKRKERGDLMVERQEAEQILTYALDLGERMLIRGAEVGRVEDTLKRILKAEGANRVDVMTITNSIMVTAHFDCGALSQIRRVSGTSYDMTALTRLNDLSRHICSGDVALDQIGPKLQEIAREKPYTRPTVVLLYGFCSLVFSLFFGGSLLDAVLSGLVGMLIRVLLWVFSTLRVPGLATTMLCAVIGGFIAHGLGWLGVPCSPDLIAIGNIMLLVPGIGLTNSIRDMFTGDTIAGLLRFSECVLTALALAFGFALPGLLG